MNSIRARKMIRSTVAAKLTAAPRSAKQSDEVLTWSLDEVKELDTADLVALMRAIPAGKLDGKCLLIVEDGQTHRLSPKAVRFVVEGR